MSLFVQDVRYAVRALRRSPGFATIAILTLALGIGANTVSFSVLSGVVLRPLPYPAADRLVFVTTQFPTLGFDQFWMSVPEFLEYRAWTRSYDAIGGYTVGASNLGAGEPMRPVRATITEDLMPALGVGPMAGRGFTSADALPGAEDVAILSAELWQRAFGSDPAAIGRVVEIDGSPTRIVGIMPRGFDVHDQRVELWLPLTIDPQNPGNRGGHFLYLIGRLKEGVSLAQARGELDALIRRWQTDFPNTHTPHPQAHRVRIDPLKEDIVGGVSTALWVLQGAVGFVLFIACANLANLLLARAETRQREFAVRAALGAGTARLLRQFATEGLVLAVAAAVVGVAVAYGGLRLLLGSHAAGIPLAAGIGIDGRVLLVTLGLAALTALVFGAAPLAVARTITVGRALKEAGARGSTGGAGRRRARGLLVVAEVALAAVLVIGAGLLIRSFANLVQVDAGFDRSRMVTFGVVLPGARYDVAARLPFYRQLTDRLRQLPGVQAVSVMTGLPPLRPVNANDTDFEHITQETSGAPPENVDYWQFVSHEYVATMGIPVVRGRDFSAADVNGAPVVLVNEALATKFFRDLDPLGRRLRVGFNPTRPWATIVGVLKDVKQRGVAAEAGTELYVLADQGPLLSGSAPASLNVVLRTAAEPAALAASIRRIVREADASLPLVRYRSMDEVFADALARPRFLTTLLGVFAGLALTLAAIGTYGILSYAVSERRQEIGIRMALGASPGAVLAMVLRQGLLPAGAGLGLGLGASVLLTRLLRAQLFNVTPFDPATLGAVVLFITGVAAIACFVPARRATKVDPMIVMRSD
jgi:predicted permease